MPSVTTWVRLEPRPGDPTLASGLEARVHDPLWMLARQWQTGEFRGDDTGSPVAVDYAAAVSRLSKFRAGTRPRDDIGRLGRIARRARQIAAARDEGPLLTADWLAAEQAYDSRYRQNEIDAAEDERHAAIQRMAYDRWVRRGRAHGHAVEDWVQAEREWEAARAAAQMEQLRVRAYFNWLNDRFPGGALEDWSNAVREAWDAHRHGRIAHYAFERYRGRMVNDWLTAEAETPWLPEELTHDYDDRALPLEALVERETARPAAAAPDARQAAEAGLHFLRLLTVHNVGHYRDAFLSRWRLQPAAPAGGTADARNAGFVDVAGGRALNGVALYALLRASLPREGGGTLPPDPPVAAGDRASVTAAAQAWLAWYEGLFSEPDGPQAAWQPDRMEYTFAVAAPSNRALDREVVLAAREYTEGRLDWHSFDVVIPSHSLGAGKGEVKRERRRVLPTPVTFGGMPSPRWWEMEDRRVHFGAVDAGPEDLARLMLMEFALIYGNDFFVIPVELDVGSVCRLEPLVVTDTFGIRTLIRPHDPGEGPDWRMWSLTGDGAAGPLFFLPPTLGPSLNGPPLEEVLFLRDEAANMAWAVERLAQGPAGYPADLHAAPGGPAAPPEDSLAIGPDGRLAYRLTTGAPRNWHPLVPVRTAGSGAAVRLERRALPDPATGRVAPPHGRLLAESAGALLHEEEVPREGARVTRAFQYARWTDGSTHLWVGRRKGPGRGPGGSGLRFDAVEPASTG